VGKTAKVASAVGAAEVLVVVLAVVLVVREMVEVTIPPLVVVGDAMVAVLVGSGATITAVVRTEHLPSAQVPSQKVPHAPQF
jgi:hypothetical protein